MALIIKGEMPIGKGCDGCEYQTSRCEQLDSCTCHLFAGTIKDFHNKRHKDCPIIGEIPDKHGRLVDGDKLLADHNPNENWDYMVLECIIRNAPTVLEASE